MQIYSQSSPRGHKHLLSRGQKQQTLQYHASVVAVVLAIDSAPSIINYFSKLLEFGTTELKSSELTSRMRLGSNSCIDNTFKFSSSGAADKEWQIKAFFFPTVTLPTCLNHTGFKIELGLEGFVNI